MFCRKCGKEINNTSKFCPYCGTPVAMPAAPAPVVNTEPAVPAEEAVPVTEAAAATEAPVPEAEESQTEAPAAEAAPAEAVPPVAPVQPTPAPAAPVVQPTPQPVPMQPAMNQAPAQPAMAQPMGGQPYQPAPQPVPAQPAYSPIPADKPAKKKKGKAGIVIAIILIVLLLAGGAAAAYFFLFASPAKKISKAIEAGNMETVVELYDKVNSEKDKEQIKSDLLVYVQTLEDSYLAEDITYEDAIRTMEDLRDTVFEDGEIEDIMHTVSMIYDSRNKFAQAEELAKNDTWKTYYDAIGYYEEVISDDAEYYAKAQDAIADCRTKCISAAETEADAYIADDDYDAAVDLLEDAYYDTGYEELYDKAQQVKADMKDALLAKAIENARNEVAAGNYTEARNIINNAKEDYGYDSRFDEVLASIPVDNTLVGKWTFDYDINEVIAEEVGDELADFDSPLNVTFVFEFTEDGICRLYLDEESFGKNFDTWKGDLVDYLIDAALEEYLSDGSMTKRQFEKAFQSAYGMSMKEYFTEMLDEELDVSDLFEKEELQYYVEGDKLYTITDGDEVYYETFSIDGDTLTIGGDGTLSTVEILPGLSYPLTLTKVVD